MGKFYTKQEAIDIISNGNCVNFSVNHDEDHKYAKSKGYKIDCNSDCSYTCKELPGISFSSYGNWGTIYGGWLNDNSRKLVIEMIDNDVYLTLYKY